MNKRKQKYVESVRLTYATDNVATGETREEFIKQLLNYLEPSYQWG